MVHSQHGVQLASVISYFDILMESGREILVSNQGKSLAGILIYCWKE